MLVLNTDLVAPTGLAFSPDGSALLVVEDDRVQVWPRWLDAPARPVVNIDSRLERFAFDPTGKRVFLYKSGNSFTRVLNVASGKVSKSEVPSGGPSWFHFTTDGGFVLASNGVGELRRLDLISKRGKRVREQWMITRRRDGKPRTLIGSHFRFGAVCAATGTFVTMEYTCGRSVKLVGLTVRAVADGAQLFHKPMTERIGEPLVEAAGLTLAIHPSGAYFAYPQQSQVRFCSVVAKLRAPGALKGSAQAPFRAVAFHPAGGLLATACGAEVKLYDTKTWQVTRSFAWDIGQLHAICFAPDGTRAAVAGDSGRVVVWDVDL